MRLIIISLLCLLTTSNKESKSLELWHQVQVPLFMLKRCVWLVLQVHLSLIILGVKYISHHKLDPRRYEVVYRLNHQFFLSDTQCLLATGGYWCDTQLVSMSKFSDSLWVLEGWPPGKQPNHAKAGRSFLI